MFLAAVVAALAQGFSAAADDYRGESRVRGTCTNSSTLRLRIDRDDGRMRIDVRLAAARAVGAWQVVLVRERRIAFRGTVETSGKSSAELHRTVPDWPGMETVVLRATADTGETCRAVAIV